MLEFYLWPRAACLTITFLLALSVLAQTLTTILSLYKYPRSKRWAFETLLELLVLVYVYTCSLMHGQAIQGYIFSVVPQTGYVLSRTIIFAVIILVSTTVMLYNRKPFPLLIIAAAGLTLPVTESLTGRVFAYLYAAAVLFWLCRSIRMSLIRFGEIRINISALSIKNAIDSLNAGIMFCEDDGFILLSNTQMQQLMMEIIGKLQRNGRQFYEALAAVQPAAEPPDKIQSGCQKAEHEGKIVCLLPNKTAWIFTKTDITIGKKQYFQLSASDITQQWSLTAKLRQQEDLLKIRGEELKDMIANLHILSRERETQKIRMLAHDILGGRLAMLLHAVRGEAILDPDLLRSQIRFLLDDLKSEQAAPGPQDEFDSLKQVFGAIGVDIRFEGTLPNDAEKAKLILEIIREGVTNSVRHGYATQISISIVTNNGGGCLKISDNGHPPVTDITEGGGLGGMRERLRLYDGVLSVAAQPEFVLTANLPGANNNE